MFCRKCGKEIPDDSEFCPKCGAPIGNGIFEQISTQTDETATDIQNNMSVPYTTNEHSINETVKVLADKPKKSIKAIIITLAAVAMAALAAIFIPMAVSKSSGAHSEFEYQLKADDTYVISKYLGTDPNVVIPAEIDRKPVSEVGEMAFSGSSIESVTIGENVWEIGNSAFSNCRNLRYVEILPNDDFVIDIIEGDILINSIGDSAFANCSALETFIFPDNNFTEIGAKAFYQCAALKSVELTGIRSVGEKAFSETGLQSANLHSGETASAVFANCKDLKEVTLGNLVDISDEMFSGCTSLETVNWNFSPYMENKIGSKAFYGCTSLKQFNTIDTPITYPRGFSDFIAKFKDLGAKDVVIAEDAFENCEKFKDPEPTTKHNEWAGTIYLGKTLRQAAAIANRWEDGTYLGPCTYFYDPLGRIIGNGGIGYNDKITLAVFSDNGRYLTSDTGKTDFVYIGMTIKELTEKLEGIQAEKIYNAVMDSYYYIFDLYGYNFELYTSGSYPDSIITSAWVRIYE